MSTSTTPVVYPVHVEAELDPQLSRGLWLVKWLLAIPHYLVLAFLWVAFAVTSVVAFFAILFTAHYPRALFDFNVGVMRWTWRVAYYAYGALGTDRYPPFTLAEVADYPAHLSVDYPERLSRGLVLVKWWLLAIPHYLIVALFVGGLGYGIQDADEPGLLSISLIGVLVLVAGVVLLFSGRYPRPVFDLVLGLNRWVLRVAGYVALMTDRYPPFSLDQGSHDPSGGAAGPVGTLPPAAPTPNGPPTSPATGAATGWTAGRVVSLVLGAMLVMGGLGIAGGGAALLAADQTARDADGFVTSSQERLASDGFAVVSEDAQIHTGGSLAWLPDELIGDVRLSPADAAADDALFVGVARSADLRTYLAGVEHDTLLGIESGEPSYRATDGGAVPAPPTDQAFWVAQAIGQQPELTWTLEDGDWTAVVMNADGSSDVTAEVSVGAELPQLGAAISILFMVAAVTLLIGTLLIAVPIRLASRAQP